MPVAATMLSASGWAATRKKPGRWGSGVTLTWAWLVMSPPGRLKVVKASKTAHGGGVDVEQKTSSWTVPIRSPVARSWSSNSNTVRLGVVEMFFDRPRELRASTSPGSSAGAAAGKTKTPMAKASGNRRNRRQGEMDMKRMLPGGRRWPSVERAGHRRPGGQKTSVGDEAQPGPDDHRAHPHDVGQPTLEERADRVGAGEGHDVEGERPAPEAVVHRELHRRIEGAHDHQEAHPDGEHGGHPAGVPGGQAHGHHR